MKPDKFNDLSPEDAGVILELSQKLDIVTAKRLVKAVTDRKFRIETSQGEKQLLVVNTSEHYDWLESDFRTCEYVASYGINIMRPISMGTFREGTLAYQLYTWFDGVDLEEVLTHMTHAEQYSTGKKAGELLRKLHALSPMHEAEPWGIRIRRRVHSAIQAYNDNLVRSQGADLLARYLQDNQDLLENRPQAFTHGDCNTGNLMLCKDGQIGIIDLGWGNNCNDPWWDFKEVVSPNIPPVHFIMGLIRGYFEGEPPPAFFRLLSFYIALGTLESVRELTETDFLEQVRTTLNMFDDMQSPVPVWYISQALATRDDVPEIVSIYRSLIGTPGCTWDEGYPSEETAEHDINNGWLYIFKKQDKIVGVASIGDFGELSDLKWKPKNPCELARIGVHPEFQQQGIGTLMLQYCFETAKKQGFDGIRILVAKTNTPALALYEKNGFELCGEVFRFNIDFYCYQTTFTE